MLPPIPLSSPGLTGRPSTLQPIGSIADASGILGAPVKPGHDSGDDVTHRSRGMICPGCPSSASLGNPEGAGNAGRRCTRGLVCRIAKRNAHELITGTTEHVRHSPRDVGRLIPCSPRRTGLCSHRHPQSACELDTSIGVSGPHGFVGRVPRLVMRANASIASRLTSRDDWP